MQDDAEEEKTSVMDQPLYENWYDAEGLTLLTSDAAQSRDNVLSPNDRKTATTSEPPFSSSIIAS